MPRGSNQIGEASNFETMQLRALVLVTSTLRHDHNPNLKEPCILASLPRKYSLTSQTPGAGDFPEEALVLPRPRAAVAEGPRPAAGVILEPVGALELGPNNKCYHNKVYIPRVCLLGLVNFGCTIGQCSC